MFFMIESLCQTFFGYPVFVNVIRMTIIKAILHIVFFLQDHFEYLMSRRKILRELWHDNCRSSISVRLVCFVA